MSLCEAVGLHLVYFTYDTTQELVVVACAAVACQCVRQQDCINLIKCILLIN